MNKYIFKSINLLLIICFIGCKKKITNQIVDTQLTTEIERTMILEPSNQEKSLDEILAKKGLEIEDILPNHDLDAEYHFTKYELYSEEPFIIKIDPNTMKGYKTNSCAYITEHGNVLISMNNVDVEVIGPKEYQEMLTIPGPSSVSFIEFLDDDIWRYMYSLDKSNHSVMKNDIVHDDDDFYIEYDDLEIAINGYTIYYNYRICELNNIDEVNDNSRHLIISYASYVEIKDNLHFACNVTYSGEAYIEDLPTPEEVLAGLYESILPIE